MRSSLLVILWSIALHVGTMDAEEFGIGWADSLQWPMDHPPRITSTFGEYRKGHFHAGIDFSTYGRSGYALRAMSSGSLWRVKVDPAGYGNALYLMLDDGRIVVYAHMKRFSKKVEQCVREMQEETGRYMVDFYPDQERITFRKGETVGISGGTGAGPPHLHLEIRNRENEPQNPLLDWFAVPDSTPPRFYQLVLTAMDAGARVDGKPFSRRIRLRFLRDKKIYEALSRPQIWGEVGLSARVFDRINLGGDRVGIYKLSTTVDGEEIFVREYRSFPFDQFKLNGLVYDHELMSSGFGRCERVYRLPGDDLRFHENSPGDGILRAGLGALDYGEHIIEIHIEDVAGNKRKAVLPVVVNMPPEIVKAVWTGMDSITIDLIDEEPEDCSVAFRRKRKGRWEAVRGERLGVSTWRVARPEPGSLLEVIATDPLGGRSSPFYKGQPLQSDLELMLRTDFTVRRNVVKLRLSSSKDLARSPTVFVAPGRLGYTRAIMWAKDEKNYEMELSMFPEISPGYRVLIMGEGIDGSVGKQELSIPLSPIAMNQSSTILSPDARAWIAAGPGSVFEDTYVEVGETKLTHAPGGLEALTSGYKFSPTDAILKKQITVGLKLPETEFSSPNGGIGIFKWRGGKNYKFVGSAFDASTNSIVGSTTSLGTFVLLRDSYAPSVDVSPSQGSVLSGRRPTIRANVHDFGCGIDTNRVQMFLDGRPVPARPSGSGRWIYKPRENLPRGLHTIRMVARDKVGNPGSAQATFRIR